MQEKSSSVEKAAKNRPPYTKTVESGAFIRTRYRIGDKRKVKTEKFTKNQKKAIFGHIGDFEVYTYPYDYPDTVFIGTFPISTKIDSSNVNQLIRAYNMAKAYLSGNYFSKPNSGKGANSRRQLIQRAYNQGLEEQRGKKQP